MADYYTEFSFMIPASDEEERKFLVAWTEEPDEPDEDWDEYYHSGVCVVDEGDAVWVHADAGYGSPENAAALVAEWQTKFNKDDFVSFEYSFGCSKPRLDAFGGGGVLIHKGEEHWAPQPGLWISNKQKELEKQCEKSD
jgi:hypothetical protein